MTLFFAAGAFATYANTQQLSAIVAKEIYKVEKEDIRKKLEHSTPDFIKVEISDSKIKVISELLSFKSKASLTQNGLVQILQDAYEISSNFPPQVAFAICDKLNLQQEEYCYKKEFISKLIAPCEICFWNKSRHATKPEGKEKASALVLELKEEIEKKKSKKVKSISCL